MASTRERRSNAGNKMSRLLEEEEVDEFYKNTYGGFDDEEDDKEFAFKADEDIDDEVDSDFSIDENDEPVSDHEEEGGPKRKRGAINTKAYKEPARPKEKSKTQPGQATEDPEETSEPVTAPEKPSKAPKLRLTRRGKASAPREKKSVRTTTALKSAETIRRVKERETGGKKRSYRRESHVKYTQDELLEEAKETELLNLESLEKYKQLEMEKKKTRAVKKAPTGPTIQYVSTIMPWVEDVTSETDRNINVDEDDSKPDEAPVVEFVIDSQQKCERSFITFSSDKDFNTYFKKSKEVQPQKNICPITRLPARYFDPVTQLPYATLQAFRILREAYYQQLEAKGDVTNPEIGKWVEWRKKYRQARLAALAVKQAAQAAAKNAS